MGIGVTLILFLVYTITAETDQSINGGGKREIIDVKGAPDDVVWIVQLSDLHFSVHHPERALDFKNLVGPSLSMINPSLVLITGDLTDGKSKDLLTMKQHEEEWVEYQQVMEDVVQRSGLNKSIFYDLRGNHDNFGVPAFGDSLDFFSKYSLNGKHGRNGLVNSVTIQTGERKLLFVGFDSTMSVGLRGPTNLFGHPNDQLLSDISSELSQWDTQFAKPVTKISFGHFPLSFSAPSYSGKTLKHTFLKHSLSAYLCGHLHTRFGKNLKRHHESNYPHFFSQKFIQWNSHTQSSINCSKGAPPIEDFWEWEMGDWRKSRAIRILAIDRGDVSFVDSDFKSGAKTTIILPTFPLDSRFISTRLVCKYKSQAMDFSSYKAIRAMVFSSSPIVSVVSRIYDSSLGFIVVMEESMKKHGSATSRGDLYSAPWNYVAFEDPSPDRFWLQIEATDLSGRSTMTELRPFSVHGRRANLSWTWKEFLVMGCQWAALYFPILWLFYAFMFSMLIIPKAIIVFSKNQCSYKKFKANKNLINGMAWVFTEFYRLPWVWFCAVAYLFYLILCPWLLGQVLTDDGERGYMTYKGWVIKLNMMRKLDFLGFPDIMVVVLPHLFFVVLPAYLLILALAAERGIYRDHLLSLSEKKEDDYDGTSVLSDHERSNRFKFYFWKRWTRNILLVVALAICWKHFQNCRALMKAYDMNLFVHFPLYSLTIPVLLVYTVYNTSLKSIAEGRAKNKTRSEKLAFQIWKFSGYLQFVKLGMLHFEKI